MSRSYSPDASFSLATDHACRPLAAVSSRSVDSQVNPSPSVCHSTPSSSASFRSPVFHFPPLMNWTTPTRHPRAQPRPITPKAADDLPFPCPVFKRTIERATATDGSLAPQPREPGANPGLSRNCYRGADPTDGHDRKVG